MKFIAVSFTIKGQKMSDIKPVLEQLSERYGGKSGHTVLIHGFMPRHAVVEKGFSTELVDTLDELFPEQVGCYHNGKPNRDAMVAIVADSGAEVYAIGEIIEGVAEEVKLYREAGIHVSELPLNWNGNMIGRPLTYGEQAVNLNPPVYGEIPKSVYAIKRACANVIDELNSQREVAKSENNSEKIALYTLAIREIQAGQMRGVQAATWQY